MSNTYHCLTHMIMITKLFAPQPFNLFHVHQWTINSNVWLIQWFFKKWVGEGEIRDQKKVRKNLNGHYYKMWM
jgi:hypothetical protein